MESTGAHRTEAMPSYGLRRRRRPRRPEAKTIRVESLLGHRTFSLELDLTETIAKVKSMIYEQEGTHPTQQVLIFREQQLNDDHRTLADYGVQHGPSSSLLLDTRLHGGDPPEVIQRLSYRRRCFLSNYIQLHVEFCQCSLAYRLGPDLSVTGVERMGIEKTYWLMIFSIEGKN